MSNLEEEVEYVWEGNYLKDDKHLNDLREQFLHNLENNINNIESDINTCKDEFDRIQIIKKLFQWIPVPKYYFERFRKSSETSSKLREKANLAYKEINHMQALRGYSLAIMFAPINSVELALSYGNRSALFVQMKKYHLALEDIKLALSCPYPDLLKNKLLDRERKCTDFILQKEIDNNMKNESTLIAKNFCDENVLRLKTHNDSISNAEEFVSINYTKERGRRLVVNKNIPAGTVLVFEKPYAYILSNYLTWDTAHCHYCSKKIIAGIPCTVCTFAIYCKEECRKNAATWHFIEHKMLPYHHCHESALKDLISIRIIIRAGPKLLFDLFQRRKQSYAENDNYDGHDVYFNPHRDTVLGHNDSGIYESESYLPIYHLISHAKSTPLKDIVSNVFRAIVLTQLLRDTSSFFESLKDHYSEEFSQVQFEDFVVSLLLRHIENIPCNAVSISELQNYDKHDLNITNLKNCKSHSYATGIFCLISLTNHSCDPNAVIAKKSEFQQTALVSVRSLNAGDEIFITYKPQFTSQITKDRRMFLLDRYHFICQCQACVSNWCLESHANYQIPLIKCTECKKKSTKACKACEQASKKLAFQLENFQSKLYEADDFIQSGNYVQAIHIIKDSLQFFSQLNVSSVFSLFQVAQDLYKRALLFLLYSYD